MRKPFTHYLPKHQRDRATFIIDQLGRMARDGWKDASPSEYIPLQHELETLRKKGDAIRLKTTGSNH